MNMPLQTQKDHLFLLCFTSLKSKIEQLMEKSSFDAICFVEKSLCITLNYLTKWQHYFPGVNYEFVYGNLRDCVKIIKTLALSTEYHKFGHRLALFSFLAKRFEKWNQEKFNCSNSYNLQNRIQKNELSQYYVCSKQKQISIQQQGNPLFQKLFKEICSCQTLFQNHQCLRCSQVFIKGYTLSNNNQVYPFIGMSAFNSHAANFGSSFDIIHLQRCLNALCNKGGGILVIGTEIKNNRFQVVGIQLDSQQAILQKQKIILQTINKIKPAFYFEIHKILVYKSIEQIELKKQRNKVTICFRVVVRPALPKALSYIEHWKKQTSETTYQFFQLDQINKIKKIEITNSERNLTIYTKILQHYKERKKISRDSHYPILCYRPQQFYLPSLICGSFYLDYNPQKHEIWTQSMYSNPYPPQFTESTDNKQQIQFNSSESNKYSSDVYSDQSDNNGSKNENETEEEVQFINSIPHEINFKYKNTNLIVIPSKKQNRQLQVFAKELTKIKYVFCLSKPYQEDFGPRLARQIWLISHEKKTRELKRLITACEQNRLIKSKSIKIMPIFKILQMEQSEKFLNFSEWFQQRFDDSFIVHKFEEEGKDKVNIQFKDNYQSIYAYMICQSFSLRPYFVKRVKN